MEQQQAKSRVSLGDVIDRFREFNRKHGITYGDHRAQRIYAVVVYGQENFSKPYSLEARSYLISNLCGKAFFTTVSGSRSMSGDSLDGTDVAVRLDAYPWEVEYCYFSDEHGAEVTE